MKKPFAYSLITSCLVLLGTVSNLSAQYVIPPHSMVEGKTLAEWSAEWWKWVLSLPVTGHPWYDETGIDAARGQSGPVFHLVGMFAQSSTYTNRAVTLPEGTWKLLRSISYGSPRTTISSSRGDSACGVILIPRSRRAIG